MIEEPNAEALVEATRKLMTVLAEAGKLEDMCVLVTAHIALHPSHRAALLWSMPKKVASAYLGKYRGRSLSACLQWREENPDWSDRLKRHALEPARFAMIVGAMDAQIEALEQE
jgi:hypothetical protein